MSVVGRLQHAPGPLAQRPDQSHPSVSADAPAKFHMAHARTKRSGSCVAHVEGPAPGGRCAASTRLVADMVHTNYLPQSVFFCAEGNAVVVYPRRRKQRVAFRDVHAYPQRVCG